MNRHQHEFKEKGFAAQYKGQCVYCLEEIIPGQMVMYWRQKLYHFPECKKEAYAEQLKKDAVTHEGEEG